MQWVAVWGAQAQVGLPLHITLKKVMVLTKQTAFTQDTYAAHKRQGGPWEIPSIIKPKDKFDFPYVGTNGNDGDQVTLRCARPETFSKYQP